MLRNKLKASNLQFHETKMYQIWHNDDLWSYGKGLSIAGYTIDYVVSCVTFDYVVTCDNLETFNLLLNKIFS